MRDFRIGIFGAGSIVEGNHLPAIVSLQQAKVAWIYDKNASRCTLVSKMYGVPALAEASIEQGLEKVDICLLATPYGTRRPYIDLCRQHGKAIVIEKPFAFSKKEHLASCAGFSEWGIAVNFQRRFYRSVAILTKIIRSGLLGTLRSVSFLQGNFTLKGGSGYLSSATLAGGGVIAESSSHILDIILLITGAKNIQLLDLRSLYKDGLDYDTVFDSLITTSDGEVPVHCEITTLRNLSNGLYLDFENGLLSCDLSPDGKLFLRNRKDHKIEFSLCGESLYEGMEREATRINEAFLIFWQQFIQGMQTQQSNFTSACSSLLTSSWLEEIYKKINHVYDQDRDIGS
jgi:hypothetical protein